MHQRRSSHKAGRKGDTHIMMGKAAEKGQEEEGAMAA